MTSLLIRVDTIVNTNVKRSKVFGLAFVKVAGVTDVFTQDEIRAFVLPKLSADQPETLVGSAIVQLDNVSSGGENANHSGRGDERFTGVLTKVFSNGLVDDTVTTNATDVTGTAGVDVYFLTMDGINETAVRCGAVHPLATGASVSASVNGVHGTKNSLVYESSSLSDMVYKQLVPDTGDYIHSSGAFQGGRSVISLIDGVTNNWNNAWHGPHGIATLFAIYEFAYGEEKLVSSMDFYQVPSGGHYAGVINIYYWDGSTFVEVSYTNNNQFVNTIYSETINISFHTVQSNQFKIRVNKHAGNGTIQVGLSGWTLKH